MEQARAMSAENSGLPSQLVKIAFQKSLCSTGRFSSDQLSENHRPYTLMPRLSKIELSPDNGCIIDMKWNLGPLSYHSSGAGKVTIEPSKEIIRLPEVVLYDHVGFKGSYARTNLSFHYLGDYWNDRMSCVIVVSGVWRFYRDEYYKGPHWDLGPGYYESFFAEKGPDDVVSSLQCIALT
jgi:Beta/Gamma crystallin